MFFDLTGVDWTPIGGQGKWSFQGIFDGNGYTVNNMHLNAGNGSEVGFFGGVRNTTIKNLGIKNATITGGSSDVGVLCGYINSNSSSTCKISNCYATGSINESSDSKIGGLIGSMYVYSCTVEDCYADVDINTNKSITGSVGGLVGNVQAGSTIRRCFAKGDIYAPYLSNVGGLTGALEGTVSDSYALGNVNGISGNSDEIVITLQIGINSSANSTLQFSTGFGFNGFDTLLAQGLEKPETLKAIDELIAKVNEKQTELGAVENRLTSLIEEIYIQYDNLVSSRSTIQDADIAEVSSEYIRHQILQQASATLMATANQTPAIALQLL